MFLLFAPGNMECRNEDTGKMVLVRGAPPTMLTDPNERFITIHPQSTTMLTCQICELRVHPTCSFPKVETLPDLAAEVSATFFSSFCSRPHFVLRMHQCASLRTEVGCALFASCAAAAESSPSLCATGQTRSGSGCWDKKRMNITPIVSCARLGPKPARPADVGDAGR